MMLALTQPSSVAAITALVLLACEPGWTHPTSISLAATGAVVVAVDAKQASGTAPQSTPKSDSPAPPTEGSTGQPAESSKQDSPRAPKSLDELLDVPVTGDAAGAGSAEDAARREQEKRLERSLDEASMQDLVRKAIDGMKTASARLGEQNDPGLGTQRVQEEVVKTLQRLLDEAEKQQRQSSSSSSSSSSGSRSSGKQSKDGKSGDPKERNGQQRQSGQQRSQGSKTESTSGSGDSETDPGMRDSDAAAEAGELSETRVEWGQLPERVRELVLQGRRDRVSTLYERLTREYYRRLAEEASK